MTSRCITQLHKLGKTPERSGREARGHEMARSRAEENEQQKKGASRHSVSTDFWQAFAIAEG
jgi:hypothetical protein